MDSGCESNNTAVCATTTAAGPNGDPSLKEEQQRDSRHIDATERALSTKGGVILVITTLLSAAACSAIMRDVLTACGSVVLFIFQALGPFCLHVATLVGTLWFAFCVLFIMSSDVKLDKDVVMDCAHSAYNIVFSFNLHMIVRALREPHSEVRNT